MFNIKFAYIFFLLPILLLLAGTSAKAENSNTDELLPAGVIIEDEFKPGFGIAVGKVVMVSGQVVILHQDKSVGYKAKKEIPLFKGDTIVTLEDGSVEIVFIDSSKLSIGNKTSLKINEAMYDPKIKDRSLFFTMLKGKTRFLVKKLFQFGRSEFKVKTNTSIAGVRGSDFIIRAGSDFTEITALDETKLEVVSLAMLGVESVVLNSLERITHKIGEPVPKPEKIDKDAIDALKKELPFLSQSADKDAAGISNYQSKIILISEDQLISPADSPDFDSRIFDQTQTSELFDIISDMGDTLTEMLHEDIVAHVDWEIPPFPDPPF